MERVLEILGAWFLLSCVCAVPVGKLLKHRAELLAMLDAARSSEPTRPAPAD